MGELLYTAKGIAPASKIWEEFEKGRAGQRTLEREAEQEDQELRCVEKVRRTEEVCFCYSC